MLDFSTWLHRQLPQYNKVQKLSVDGGFTCPNRDGRLSTGGCTFCDNRTFSPSFADRHRSVSLQLEAGKAFFSRKYPQMRYLAYFQSFTGTYAPTGHLRRLYEEALAVPGVVGIVVGTRPDCMPDDLLDYLSQLARRTFVMVEYGIETANDLTLQRINRGHTWAASREAVIRTHERGIHVGAHVILGLPGEDAAESLRQAPLISDLPIDVLKLHQLQVIRGTRLAAEYEAHPFPLYTVEEYADLVIAYISRLRPDIALDRFVSQSPPHLLVAPRWGLKNHEFADLLEKRMKRTAP